MTGPATAAPSTAAPAAEGRVTTTNLTQQNSDTNSPAVSPSGGEDKLVQTPNLPGQVSDSSTPAAQASKVLDKVEKSDNQASSDISSAAAPLAANASSGLAVLALGQTTSTDQQTTVNRTSATS